MGTMAFRKFKQLLAMNMEIHRNPDFKNTANVCDVRKKMVDYEGNPEQRHVRCLHRYKAESSKVRDRVHIRLSEGYILPMYIFVHA